MKYAIVGSGNIGKALVRLFAAKGIDVAVANSRGPETLAALAQEAGAGVRPTSLDEAVQAEFVFLAVPFSAHGEVAAKLPSWAGRIVVDVTNAMHVPPESLGGQLSSEVVAKAFSGARLVKGFNHLAAAQLGTTPKVDGQAQVVFLSSNNAEASAEVAQLAKQLGFAPVELGRLDQGGVPLHILGGKPGGLIFQNLSKLL